MVSNRASNLQNVAPLLAGLLLVLLLMIRIGFDDGEDSRSPVSVQQSLDAIPRQLGSPAATWIFLRDVPVPSTQAELLGLTSHASLEYKRASTFPPVFATVFIAYCEEIRSMAGHHPPNCYPSSGWDMDESEGGPFLIAHSSERVVKGWLYKFSRNTTDKIDLWIVNGFFDGKGGFVDRLEDAESLAGTSLFSSDAMFQFQILFQGDFRGVDIQEYAEEILGGIPVGVLVGEAAEGFGRSDRSRGAV